MESLTSSVLDFVRLHADFAPVIVFALAFGESLAFISLLLPATVVLMAIGGLIGAAGLDFAVIWLSASLGAVAGDWVSYWFGFHYKDTIARSWPLSRNPELLQRGHRFFEKWGAIGVFGGRFVGPLRCVMPLVAGICAMPMLVFQITNITSGLLWAMVVLAPGWLAAGRLS